MKTILIIGGSKGIGKSVLMQQLDLGNKVINLSRTKIDITHNNLLSYEFDILNPNFPTIDNVSHLIYCPGSINLKPLSSLSMDDFRTDMEINFFGAIACIKNYLPALKKEQNSSIVLFSTAAAKMGMPFHTSISAAKCALEGFAKSLAAELAPNVRVNTIAPSIVDTTLASRILRNDSIKEKITNNHPLKRILNTAEVAETVNYLCNSLSISGQTITLDNGITTLKI
jgi:3-oxoacyl-[acyl-carrier protein] reductase